MADPLPACRLRGWENRRVLILLPPSEGKTAPARGKPLALPSLVHPELTAVRERILDELAAVSRREDAPQLLKVSAGLREEVRANTLVREVPTAAAEKVYTGVLFDALDAGSLEAPARRRMSRRVLVFSALFGVLRMSDRIPAYRLSGSVSLPGTGVVSTYWREPLREVLRAPGLVVDCRSSAYAAMWGPPGDRHLPVRVFREVDGERSVVSHMAKHSRGLVARALCEEPTNPRTAVELVELLDAYFHTHEVRTAAGAPVAVRVELGDGTIDVVTT